MSSIKGWFKNLRKNNTRAVDVDASAEEDEGSHSNSNLNLNENNNVGGRNSPPVTRTRAATSFRSVLDGAKIEPRDAIYVRPKKCFRRTEADFNAQKLKMDFESILGNWFSRLPLEILDIVLHHLDVFSLTRLSATNSFWYQFIYSTRNDLWRNAVLRCKPIAIQLNVEYLTKYNIDWSEVPRYKFGKKRCTFCSQSFKEFMYKKEVCKRHSSGFGIGNFGVDGVSFWNCCRSQDPMAKPCSTGLHSYGESISDPRERNLFWSLSTLLNTDLKS